MGEQPAAGWAWPSAESRSRILSEAFAALAALRDLEEEPDEGRGPHLETEFQAALDRLEQARRAYREDLPGVALSRCPFTGELLSYSLDPFGLDGLWWDAEAPIRPLEEPLPSTFFALTGALCLEEPVERFPFLCKPGPEAPFVVPRLLAEPEIRAVISSVTIGPHSAYPVVYFASPEAPPVPRINTWGTNDYRFRDLAGNSVWDEVPEDPEDYAFDFASWIAEGKLLWIERNDSSLTLRAGDGCPYLDLPGRRQPLRIQAGEVWT